MNDTTAGLVASPTEAQAAPALPALVLVMKNVPVKYNFKTVVVRDAEGKPILEKDESGKLVEKKEKRPAIELKLPVPTLESLFAGADIPMQYVLDKDKNVIDSEYAHPEHRVLFELMQDYIQAQGKDIVDESSTNESVIFPADVFDFGKIVRKPKYERKGGFDKELLEGLCDSYSDAMKAIGKNEKGIKIACHYFMRRAKGLDAVRQEIVKAMQNNLGVWFSGLDQASGMQEKFMDVYELLDKRMSAALETDASIM